MAKIPGLETDVYFGDAESPLPNWREDLQDDDLDEDILSPEEAKAVWSMIGLKPSDFGNQERPILQEEAYTQLPESRFAMRKMLSYHVKKQFINPKQPKVSDARGKPCKPGQSAERTGCIPKKKEPGQSGSSGGTTASAAPAQPAAALAPAPAPPAPNPEQAKQETFNEISSNFPDDVKKSKKLMARAKKMYHRVHGAVAHTAIKTAAKLGAAAPMIMMKASDMSRHMLSLGDSQGHGLDPVANNFGVSSHIAMEIVSRVLVKASNWIKGRLQRGKDLGDHMSMEEQAKHIAELMQEVMKKSGFKKEVSEEDVLKFLKQSDKMEKEEKQLLVRTKRWVTIEGGTHVEIDDSGEIEKGPKGTVGKKPDQLKQGRMEQLASKKPSPKEGLSNDNPFEGGIRHITPEQRKQIFGDAAKKVTASTVKKAGEAAEQSVNDSAKQMAEQNKKNPPKPEQIKEALYEWDESAGDMETEHKEKVGGYFGEMAKADSSSIIKKAAGSMLSWIGGLAKSAAVSVVKGLARYGANIAKTALDVAKGDLKSIGRLAGGIGLHLGGIAIGIGIMAIPILGPVGALVPATAPAPVIAEFLLRVGGLAIGALISKKIINVASNAGQKIVYNETNKSLPIQIKGLEHKKGCLMAVLPDELRKTITDWTTETILDAHLGKGGRELTPHVTILYGFNDNSPELVEQLRSMLTRHGPFNIQLKGLSLFKGNDDGDVLKVDVESPELHELNRMLKEMFNVESKYPDYKPHVTLAYLTPESSSLYEEETSPFANRTVHIEEAEWGGAGEVEKVTIPLSFLNMQKALACCSCCEEGKPCADDKQMEYPSKDTSTSNVGAIIKDIQKICSTFRDLPNLGPDYQRAFYHPEKREIFWESADGDDPKSVDIVRSRLKQVPGILRVSGKAEGQPEEGAGWIVAFPAKEQRDWKAMSWLNNNSGGALVGAKLSRKRVKDAYGNDVELGDVITSKIINGYTVEKIVSQIKFPREDVGMDTPSIGYRWVLKRNGKEVARVGNQQDAERRAMVGGYKSIRKLYHKAVETKEQIRKRIRAGQPIPSVALQLYPELREEFAAVQKLKFPRPTFPLMDASTDPSTRKKEMLGDKGKWLAERWQKLESTHGRWGALVIALAQIAPIAEKAPSYIEAAEQIRGLSGFASQSRELLQEGVGVPKQFKSRFQGKRKSQDQYSLMQNRLGDSRYILQLQREIQKVKQEIQKTEAYRGPWYDGYMQEYHVALQELEQKLAQAISKKSLQWLRKDKGEPCKQGEAASRTGCVPKNKETEPKEGKADEQEVPDAPVKGEPTNEDYYIDQALGNLRKTSRTAQGVVDTSASAGKADKIVAGLTGDEAKQRATANFEEAIRKLYKIKDNVPETGEEALELSDKVAALINKGILKSDALLRTDDSTKFPYTAVANLPLARQQFGEELARRLNDPDADPVETAAWIEWRANLTDHFWADGVGKTSKALAALALMKAGLPLPKYPSNREFFEAGDHEQYNPNNGAESYLDENWNRFLSFYKRIMVASKPASRKFVMKAVNPQADETQAAYKQADGQYTPERKALHKKITNRLIGKSTPVENPVVYMLGGGTAAGKSTFIRSGQIQLPENRAKIDPDYIKSKLPEYQEGMFAKDAGASGFVHEESSDISNDVLSESVSTGRNVSLDGTGDSSLEKLTSKIQTMRAKGHKVVAHYITCPIDAAILRSDARAEKTGRFVPHSVIRQNHTAVSEIFPQALKSKLFDECSLFDSESKKKVLSYQNGELVVHEPELYEKFLRKNPNYKGEK